MWCGVAEVVALGIWLKPEEYIFHLYLYCTLIKARIVSAQIDYVRLRKHFFFLGNWTLKPFSLWLLWAVQWNIIGCYSVTLEWKQVFSVVGALFMNAVKRIVSMGAVYGPWFWKMLSRFTCSNSFYNIKIQLQCQWLWNIKMKHLVLAGWSVKVESVLFANSWTV